MEDYDWLELNPSGLVRVKVDDEWIDLRRAKIGDYRKFGLMLEDADAATRAMDKALRDEVGFTEEQQQEWMTAMQGMELGVTPGGDVLIDAAKIADCFTDYQAGLRRWLISDENPYPAIWHELLLDMGNFDLPVDDMPTGMLAQTVISEVITHFQTAPLVHGTPPAPTSPSPNRNARRANGARSARTTTTRT